MAQRKKGNSCHIGLQGDGSLCGGDGSLCDDLGECRDILRMLLVYVESGRIPLLPYSGKLSREKTFANW